MGLFFLGLNTAWATAQSREKSIRIETEVFSDQPPRLVSKSLTLFDGPVVYDFLMTPAGDSSEKAGFSVEQVFVFDSPRQKIVLLDQQQQQRLELGYAELLSMVASMQASETLRARDEFLLEPKLTENFDPQTRVLALASPRLTYRTQGQVVSDAQVLSQYYQFADWAARLNVTDSRKLPPFARLQLNQALKRRGWMPTEVEIDLTTLQGQQLRATAKHHTLYQLSENDHQRIASVQKQLHEFPSVSLTRFRNLTVASQR
jgi:hypothetical protein